MLVLGIIAIIFLAIFLPLHFTGVLNKIQSAEDLKNIILSGGAWSYAIFFLIQFLQVTFLPIPAAVTTVAGCLVFGPWVTCAISFVAVFLASILAFLLGKKIGSKIVIWIAGESDYQKWAEKLGQGKYVFFLMMLFPVFPDDILCMIAGTTNMSWKFFTITNLITRPIGIFCTCFLSSGIIPFSGWWIALWVGLALICALLFILSYKYQKQIENFVLKLAGKLEKKDNEVFQNSTETQQKSLNNKNEDSPDSKTIEDNKKTDH